MGEVILARKNTGKRVAWETGWDVQGVRAPALQALWFHETKQNEGILGKEGSVKGHAGELSNGNPRKV